MMLLCNMPNSRSNEPMCLARICARKQPGFCLATSCLGRQRLPKGGDIGDEIRDDHGGY